MANHKVEVASTNLGDVQQLAAQRGPARRAPVIWVSKLIPNDPIVVPRTCRRLKSAIQESLVSMKSQPETFKEVGATVGGFVAADDGKYQVVRDLNETAKRLKAQK